MERMHASHLGNTAFQRAIPYTTTHCMPLNLLADMLERQQPVPMHALAVLRCTTAAAATPQA
jgi:hypothetical protein